MPSCVIIPSIDNMMMMLLVVLGRVDTLPSLLSLSSIKRSVEIQKFGSIVVRGLAGITMKCSYCTLSLSRTMEPHPHPTTKILRCFINHSRKAHTETDCDNDRSNDCVVITKHSFDDDGCGNHHHFDHNNDMHFGTRRFDSL